MRTTKTVSISMSPEDLKVAERLARTTNRTLSGLFREGLKRIAAAPIAAGVADREAVRSSRSALRGSHHGCGVYIGDFVALRGEATPALL
jgi:hypothetical protein